MTTISTRLTQLVSYTSGSYNPLTILPTGGILAATGSYALSLGGGVTWSVLQEGTISAVGSAGVIIGAGSLTNTAGALIEGATYGVVLNGAGTITNAGTIGGGTDAVSLTDGFTSSVVIDPGAVFNGTVNGGGYTFGVINYSVLEFAAGAAAGTFSGLGSKYVNFAAVTIDSGAAWTAAGVNALSAAGEPFINAGTLTNIGTIRAGTNVSLTAGATLVNAGSISAAQKITGSGTDTVINSGQIYGHSGVNLASGGVTNLSTGTIVGQAYGVLVGTTAMLSNAGYVYGRSDGAVGLGSSITNLTTGTIRGGSFGIVELNAGKAATIVNAGTIMGGGVNPFAVSFAPSATGVLVVETGAYFVGTVSGGATASLEFSSGSGSLGSFGTSVVGFPQITFDPGSKWILSGAGAAFGTGVTISGLEAGGTIEILGTAETLSALSGGYLTLSGGDVLDVPGATFLNVIDSGGNTYITACFATGTRIAGECGQVPVEELRVGDRVPTAGGRLATVKWIGFRRTNLAKHPSPLDVMPVRVQAGAFGEGMPIRDLVLSPDHAVYVDGHLVPIRHLINGVSIVQETRDAITYWHVELDRHDVILAEGLPCESFLDTGNRSAFENAPDAVAMTPDFARAVWTAEGCAPILTDPADPRLRALHMRMLAPGRRRTDALPTFRFA